MFLMYKFLINIQQKTTHYVLNTATLRSDFDAQPCLFVWNRPGTIVPLRQDSPQSVVFCLKTEPEKGAINLAYGLLRFVEREHQRQHTHHFHACYVTYQMDRHYTYGLIVFSEGFQENWLRVYELTDAHAEGYAAIGTFEYGVKLLTSLNQVPLAWLTENFVTKLIWKARYVTIRATD